MDDNSDLTALFALLLKTKFDLPCHCFRRVADLQQMADQVLTASLGVLDINLGVGEPTGVDALLWLKERKFSGQLIVLTGHGSTNPMVQKAQNMGVKVYEKPLKTEALLEIVQITFGGKVECEISSK